MGTQVFSNPVISSDQAQIYLYCNTTYIQL